MLQANTLNVPILRIDNSFIVRLSDRTELAIVVESAKPDTTVSRSQLKL